MKTSAEDYLNARVKPIIESMAQAVITEKPKEPVSIYIL